MSAPLEIVFQVRATREIEEINGWWRTNRSAAPDLFALELRATLSIAAVVPTLGGPARDARLPGVKRLILQAEVVAAFGRQLPAHALSNWEQVQGEPRGLSPHP